MSENLKKILLSEASKKKPKKSSKMLDKLHQLDTNINFFIEQLEDKVNETENNPVFVRKCHKLIANMSKEYSEFLNALRAVVNAVDRKSKILPSFGRQDSSIRDIRSGNDKEETVEEPEDNSPVKEALER